MGLQFQIGFLWPRSCIRGPAIQLGAKGSCRASSLIAPGPAGSYLVQVRAWQVSDWNEPLIMSCSQPFHVRKIDKSGPNDLQSILKHTRYLLKALASHLLAPERRQRGADDSPLALFFISLHILKRAHLDSRSLQDQSLPPTSLYLWMKEVPLTFLALRLLAKLSPDPHLKVLASYLRGVLKLKVRSVGGFGILLRRSEGSIDIYISRC